MHKKINALFFIAIVFTIAFLIPMNVQAQTIYKGIDVYEYTNISDYQKLKNSGVSVVIQKATQGMHHNDALLYYRANILLQYGFKVGYYHFADNSGNPVGEAQHFLDRIKGLHLDTCLWLDIENESDWTKWQAIDYTNRFISYVQSRGYKIGIYTGLSFYYEYLNENVPSNIPLWLASYGKQPLQFPSTVSWQYTGTGYNAGLIGYADKDYFNDNIFTGNRSVPKQNTQKKDTSISNLQTQLNSLINAKLKVDGILGPTTKAAIQKFQKIMGLAADGIAGEKTWNAINQIRSYPTDGVSYLHSEYTTRWIQWRVHSDIDGTYGYNTVQKVIAFQKYSKLTPDGVVGSQTWKAMFK